MFAAFDCGDQLAKQTEPKKSEKSKADKAEKVHAKKLIASTKGADTQKEGTATSEKPAEPSNEFLS